MRNGRIYMGHASAEIDHIQYASFPYAANAQSLSMKLTIPAKRAIHKSAIRKSADFPIRFATRTWPKIQPSFLVSQMAL
jgi:hypothetical protein